MIPRASLDPDSSIIGFEARTRSTADAPRSMPIPIPGVAVSHGRIWTQFEAGACTPWEFQEDGLEQRPLTSARQAGKSECDGGLADLFEAYDEGSEDSFWSDGEPKAPAVTLVNRLVTPMSADTPRHDSMDGLASQTPLPEPSQLSLLARRRLRWQGAEQEPLTIDSDAPIEPRRHLVLHVGSQMSVTPTSFLEMARTGSLRRAPPAAPLSRTGRLIRALFEADGIRCDRFGGLLAKVELATHPVSVGGTLGHEMQTLERLFGRAPIRLVIGGYELRLPDVSDLFYGIVSVSCWNRPGALQLPPRLSYSVSRMLGLAWFVSGRLEMPSQIFELKQLRREIQATCAPQAMVGGDHRRMVRTWALRCADLDRGLMEDFRHKVRRDEPLIGQVLSGLAMDSGGIEQAEALGPVWHEHWSAVSTLLALAKAQTTLDVGRLASSPIEQVKQMSLVAQALWCLHQQIDWEAAWQIAANPEQIAAVSAELCEELDTLLLEEEPDPMARLTTLIQHPLVILRQAGLNVTHLACDEWVGTLCLQHPWAFWALCRLFPELPGRLQSYHVDDVHKLLDNAWMLWMNPEAATQDLGEWTALLEIRFRRRLSGPLLDSGDPLIPSAARLALNSENQEDLWGPMMARVFRNLRRTQNGQSPKV
jgi:hypothetical protein